MDFSVIIPSRNRPAQVQDAISSVLAQSHASFEIILVNDGSDDATYAIYEKIAHDHRDRVTLLRLEKTPRGHGPSYAINRGADVAGGRFLCFLDDDDVWTDADHLARAWSTVADAPGPVDLYFANQRAYVGDAPLDLELWLENLAQTANELGRPDAHGAYRIEVPDLLRSNGFCHLNTTIVRTTLYRSVGGMDENIRYECEWDLYYRLLGAATGIRYFPGIVSRHNVPDPGKAQNVSTGMPYLQKMLFRTYVMDKTILFSPRAEIRRKALRIKSATLKDVSRSLAAEKRYAASAAYAWNALPGSRSLGWLGHCVYAELRSAIHRVLGTDGAGDAASPANADRIENGKRT